MFFDRVFALLVLLAAVAATGCGVEPARSGDPGLVYKDGYVEPYALAKRFAPVLYAHESEPYELIAAFAVLHPSKPYIAYHLFFEHDAVLFGGGDADHEILWVEYDPVSLKTVDVMSLWHRTVIRTDRCLMEAKACGQRPTLFVQWGQHGILPLGWESLLSVRPRLEVVAHYSIVHNLNRAPKIGSRRSAVVFEGTYNDYVRFETRIDSRSHISRDGVFVAEFSEEKLKALTAGRFSFKSKKEWPHW